MKRCTTMVSGSLLGISLALVGVSVMSAAHRERMNGSAKSQIQTQVSDLEQDELNFANDEKQLRRDLRHAVNPIIVAKDRNFVRQDWLNIVVDRWVPALTSPGLAGNRDLASVIGESFARPAQELMGNLEAESRS